MEIGMEIGFVFSEKIAFTYDQCDQVVQVWEPGTHNSRVFRNKDGSAILSSDSGYWWERNKKDAPGCFYAAYWMGEFPYSSFAWGFRMCKVTGLLQVQYLETEINPRGLTAAQKWEPSCQSYIPDGMAA